MEKWKQIEGWENYEISNTGQVRSRARKVKWSHHGVSGLAKKEEKYLKQIPRIMNQFLTYLQVGLHSPKNGSKVFHIHRLVAKAFIPNLKNKPQVNHIDGNGTNNNVSNLEWVTGSENSKHAKDILGREVWHKGNKGKNTPTAKAVAQKTLDGKVVKIWECASDAVRKYDFDSGSITKCCQGKQLSHKGYKWEYA